MQKITDNYKTVYWHNEKGQLHRDNDMPAAIWKTGTMWWCKDGLPHRENGPAFIQGKTGKVKKWYLNGIEYKVKHMPLNLYMAYALWKQNEKINLERDLYKYSSECILE